MSKFRARRQWIPFVSGFGLMLVTLGFAFGAARAEPPLSDDELLTHELGQVRQARRIRIAELFVTESPCHLLPARELTQLLVLDGQFDAARGFGDGFEARCGADPIVHKWGHAPRPTPRPRDIAPESRDRR